MTNIKQEIIYELKFKSKYIESFRPEYIERKFHLSHEETILILNELILESYLYLKYEIRIDSELWKEVDDYKKYIGLQIEPWENETGIELHDSYTISEYDIYPMYYINDNIKEKRK